MEEERIDIESLFEPHEDPPAPKPKKRNFPKGIFVTLLIVGILASSVFAFVHLEDPPQDGVPQIKYTVLEKKPMYVLDNPPYLSEISSAYSWHLKDYSTEENRQANFWLRINAASKTINEDWSFSAQISSICSASVHSGHNDAHVAVTEMHSKDHAFAGWMVYGYLPRSAELELQLTLSVSLHAPDSETRSKIMPVNKAYDVEQLFACCHEYFKKTGRRSEKTARNLF